MMIHEDGTIEVKQHVIDEEAKAFLTHGVIMYACWSVLSLVQLYLNRYLRHYWRYRQLLHSIIGTIMLICTIGSASLALVAVEQPLENMVAHKYAGIVTLTFASITGLLGIVRVLMPRCCDMRWKSHTLLKMKLAHKYLALLLIVGSQVTVSLGIIRLCIIKDDKKKAGYVIIGAQNLLFFMLLLGSEAIYRIKMHSEVAIEVLNDIPNITKTEFLERIQHGEKLVLLDEYVLDVGEFM